MFRINRRAVLSSKPLWACFVASLFFVLVLAVPTPRFAYAQQNQNRGRNAAPNAAASNGDIEILHVQGNVSMLSGAGGNIAVQVGNDGVLMVDTGLASSSDKVLAAVRSLSKRPITYIINTDDRADHIGGNNFFAKIGAPSAINRASGAKVIIVSYLTVLDRLNAAAGDNSSEDEQAGWPNDTYEVPQKNLSFNGEAIQIFHQPATTDGNSVVYFRKSDVVSTGDLFDPSEYPIIDLKTGGSVQGVLEGLNRLKQIVIPLDHQEDGTMIIPGHGRICDIADMDVYQQMVTVMRDRIQAMIKDGMTVEQVKAAKPTRDYDPIYGTSTGNWTTDMFVEAVYKSLSATPGKTQQSRGAN